MLVALAIGACTDQGPIARTRAQAASGPLPAAPRYILALAAPGPVPQPLVAAIRTAGGRILSAHRASGIVVVGGLSATAATALRRQSDVAMIAPDVPLRLEHDPALARWTAPTPAHHVRSAVAVRAANPRTAAFFSAQWNMRQIQADSAWQITSQGAGATVYILDTGVDTAHVDLKGLIDVARSTSFAFADTDTLQKNPLPFSHDVVGHGTFVSSIVASNGVNVAAVAPQARIVMVRVLNDSGNGSSSALLNGILYATDNGADIINMSLGGYIPRNSGSFLSFADIYQRVVDYATQRGTVLIAAAGNESVNTNTATAPTGSFVDSLNTPAGLAHVLSVGATGPIGQTNFDQIASYSNYGQAGVGVFAPGGNNASDTTAKGLQDRILGACSSSTSFCSGQENQYLVGVGTSFASPHAAGEAAVVKANAGGAISGPALEKCLLNTATEVTGHRPDVNYNFGRIDVLSAVRSSGCK